MLLKQVHHKVIALVGFVLIATQVVKAEVYPTLSPLASGQCYKVSISQSGIYQIGTGQVAALAGCRIEDIALLGRSGRMLDETNGAGMQHPLTNIPFWAEDKNGNGVLDAGERIVFYGEGCDEWFFDDVAKRYIFNNHAYANSNAYFLTIGGAAGQQIETKEIEVNTNALIDKYTAVAHHDEELLNLYGTGQTWIGEKFTSSYATRSFTLSLPANSVGNNVRVRYGLVHDERSHATFKITVAGKSRSYTFGQGDAYKQFDESLAIAGSKDYSFAIEYTPSTGTAAGYLNYIELTATVPLAYTDGQTFIRTCDLDKANGAGRYGMRSSVTDLRVWDVTQPYRPYEMSIERRGDSCFFADTLGVRQMVVFRNGEILSPASIKAIENQNIAGQPRADLVIVAPEALIGQAERLASLHSIHDEMEVLVVKDEQVFNEFSSGKCDPLAIREMMRSFRSHYPTSAPKYLLLMGKGNYDNRHRLGNMGVTMVTYETPFSFDENGVSYCSDDLMGYLDEGEYGGSRETLDIGIGRLPARSEADAKLLVDKIERYITKSDLGDAEHSGDWRNTIALLADDADPDSGSDTIFAHSAEALATKIKNRYPHFNIDRIFADAYIQQSGAIGSYYPDVNNALRKRMDYGCLMLNYIGHGSTKYIGTERYVEVDDINGYNNGSRMPIITTSTCSFGRYDMPDDLSGAESFVLAPAAAIAAISTARPIVHIESFNTALCMEILDSGNRLGDALRKAKNAVNVSHCITLLGDPALRPSIPTKQVCVTHINEKPVAPEENDSAMVLTRVTIEGTIAHADGLTDSSFNGMLYPIVYDRETRSHTLANDNEGSEVNFWQQKNVLYKGQTEVNGGHFSYSFVVPRDVDYEYGRGKVSHYAKGSYDDATGAYSNLFFGGLDTNIVIEESRPKIWIYLGDTTFRSGGIADRNPQLFAILQDSIGINSVGSGLGHDITATLDNNGNTTLVLNDFYEADLTDRSKGYVRYDLSDLEDGWHTLTLKAWNIYNFSNSATIKFFVQSSANKVQADLTPHPNPAHDFTTIHFEHNQSGGIESAELTIYDSYGNRVKSYTVECPKGIFSAPVVWDFTNEAGAKVQGGIYVAHLVFTTQKGDMVRRVCKIVKH